jgi:hypothetical protein
MKKNLVMMIVGCAGLLSISAGANTMTVDTGAVSLGGQTVNAEAVFTTKAGELDITLRNLTSNPISVGQNLSGLSFTLSSGQTSGTLASSSGMERSVYSTLPGVLGWMNGSAVSTGWSLTGLFLNVLGTPEAPEHTIIGAPNLSNAYAAAKGSIVGGPHNPFLAGDVTFVIDIPTLTAASTITSTMFQFNTAPGSDVSVSVPDGGTTALLLGAALSGFGLLRRKLS